MNFLKRASYRLKDLMSTNITNNNISQPVSSSTSTYSSIPGFLNEDHIVSNEALTNTPLYNLSDYFQYISNLLFRFGFLIFPYSLYLYILKNQLFLFIFPVLCILSPNLTALSFAHFSDLSPNLISIYFIFVSIIYGVIYTDFPCLFALLICGLFYVIFYASQIDLPIFKYSILVLNGFMFFLNSQLLSIILPVFIFGYTLPLNEMSLFILRPILADSDILIFDSKNLNSLISGKKAVNILKEKMSFLQNWIPKTLKNELCKTLIKIDMKCEDVNYRQRVMGITEKRVQIFTFHFNQSLILPVSIRQFPSEEHIREKLEAMAYIQHCSPQALYVIRGNRSDPGAGVRCVYMSEGTYPIYGKSPETMMDQNFDIYDLIHPDDKERVQKICQDSFFLDIPWNMEYRIMVNGKYKWIRGESKPVQVDENYFEWVGLVYDISDLVEAKVNFHREKSSSLQLEGLVCSVFDISFYVDNKFLVIAENAKMRDFFEVRPNQSLTGRPLEAFLVGDGDKERFREYMCKSLEERGTRCSMLNVKAALSSGPTEVSIYASRMEEAEEVPFIANLCKRGGRYLIGVRVINTPPELGCSSATNERLPILSLLPDISELVKSKVHSYSSVYKPPKSWPPVKDNLLAITSKRHRRRKPLVPSLDTVSEYGVLFNGNRRLHRNNNEQQQQALRDLLDFICVRDVLFHFSPFTIPLQEKEEEEEGNRPHGPIILNTELFDKEALNYIIMDIIGFKFQNSFLEHIQNCNLKLAVKCLECSKLGNLNILNGEGIIDHPLSIFYVSRFIANFVCDNFTEKFEILIKSLKSVLKFSSLLGKELFYSSYTVLFEALLSLLINNPSLLLNISKTEPVVDVSYVREYYERSVRYKESLASSSLTSNNFLDLSLYLTHIKWANLCINLELFAEAERVLIKVTEFITEHRLRNPTSIPSMKVY